MVYTFECLVTKNWNFYDRIRRIRKYGLAKGSMFLGVGFEISSHSFSWPVDQNVALSSSSGTMCAAMLPPIKCILRVAFIMMSVHQQNSEEDKDIYFCFLTAGAIWLTASLSCSADFPAEWHVPLKLQDLDVALVRMFCKSNRKRT